MHIPCGVGVGLSKAVGSQQTEKAQLNRHATDFSLVGGKHSPRPSAQAIKKCNTAPPLTTAPKPSDATKVLACLKELVDFR